MKISFTTLGCKLNFAESSALAKALLERGHTRAGKGETADICIINTCSVTDAADHKDRQMIHRIRRQNPNAILIVQISTSLPSVRWMISITRIARTIARAVF